jgi:NDP-sugar pyrophosphorylase family protein
VIEVGERGEVIGFQEKPELPRPGLANAGLYVLERELAAVIPHGVFSDLAHDLFPLALDLDAALRVEPLEGSFSDIGTPETLAAAREEAAQ